MNTPDTPTASTQIVVLSKDELLTIINSTASQAAIKAAEQATDNFIKKYATYSKKEAAQILNISPPTLDAYIANGDIKTSSNRISGLSLYQYLNRD